MTMQEYFSEIKDPRHEGYIKHKLADVVVMCEVMCRMTELCEIMVFAESRAEFLAVRYNKNSVQADLEQNSQFGGRKKSCRSNNKFDEKICRR